MLNFNTVPNGNGDTGTEKVLIAGTRNELARLGSGNELIQLIHFVLIQKKKKKKFTLLTFFRNHRIYQC